MHISFSWHTELYMYFCSKYYDYDIQNLQLDQLGPWVPFLPELQGLQVTPLHRHFPRDQLDPLAPEKNERFSYKDKDMYIFYFFQNLSV